MQILEQTHKFLEQIGAKVSLQKAEVTKRQRDIDQEDANKIDAFGNRIENDEVVPKDADVNDSDEDGQTDAAKIKENLRNSSKIYYDITHSVKEDITE